MLLPAEDEARARAGERLVRGRGDEVAVRHRVRVQPGGDEARRSGPCRRAGSAPTSSAISRKLVGLDRARVGGAAADDQPRPVLLGEREHLVVVDDARLAADAVVDDRVQPAGEVDLQPVRQMAAVVEAQRRASCRPARAPPSRRPCSSARPRAAARSRARRRRAPSPARSRAARSRRRPRSRRSSACRGSPPRTCSSARSRPPRACSAR